MRRCSPWFLLLLELSCAALLWGRSLPCAGHVCRCRRPVECGNLLYVWKSPTAGWQQLGERHRVDHCRQARPIYGQKTGAELHTALLSSLAHTDLHHDWPRQGRQGTRKGRRQAPPQGSPRQHPGHHQARHPSSGSPRRREAYLRSHLRGDPRCAQGVPGECHQGCRHLH